MEVPDHFNFLNLKQQEKNLFTTDKKVSMEMDLLLRYYIKKMYVQTDTAIPLKGDTNNQIFTFSGGDITP